MMTDDELRRKVVETLAEEFELDPEAMKPEATLFDDLGLDSLDAVDMVVVLEKTFGMKLTDKESLQAVRTMNDLFELLIRLKGVHGGQQT
ncbi:acyl carrier protein [Desulfurivibrio alkaliphilus]|uniref:Acyl carrier protein n=1 Tax=Desulfurivibrio alkaliphilus (strain DSM 19089 / UNIQEM U267 / AHT2) TaxID=589865 RepID=D6Z2Q6_DESAT|nr:acyl carrier protein [Desulfurivibrio alkaliphilus]ADH85831.1 phosphopantetheine-binding protein [Desulfurivibrio alkaliphilus AHT 2]